MKLFSYSHTQLGWRIAQVVAALVCAASLLMSTVGVANADSRCNTRDHTHGALFWKRTDAFQSHSDWALPYGSNHDHENSEPTWCGHDHL